MSRRYDVAGPCKPELHSMLPEVARVLRMQHIITVIRA